MQTINTLMPFVGSVITFVFAGLVFRRYTFRRGLHLLIWGLGLTLYAIGGFMEAIHGAMGWNPSVFRLWYLCGAILVAAWLGQGTAHLLARRSWANVLLVVLVLGSAYAAFRVFTAELDPALLPGAQLSGHAIATQGVRILTPFFNIYGTFALVGGALYSAVLFWRRRVFPNRVVGNVLIAVGAMSPALGGTLSRLGLTEYLYLSEFLGAILMFIGFIRSTTPTERK